MKIAVVDDERPARKELISQILDVKPDCIVKEADSGGWALKTVFLTHIPAPQTSKNIVRRPFV